MVDSTINLWIYSARTVRLIARGNSFSQAVKVADVTRNQSPKQESLETLALKRLGTVK